MRFKGKSSEEQKTNVMCFLMSELENLAKKAQPGGEEKESTPMTVRATYYLADGRFDTEGLLNDAQITLDVINRVNDLEVKGSLRTLVDDGHADGMHLQRLKRTVKEQNTTLEALQTGQAVIIKALTTPLRPKRSICGWTLFLGLISLMVLVGAVYLGQHAELPFW